VRYNEGMEKGGAGFQPELDSIESLDTLFHKLALDEEVKIPEEMKENLAMVLEKGGARLEVSEKGRASLIEKKYTEKYPDRRAGLVEIWGEERVNKYEKWAEKESEENCPSFTFRKERRVVRIEGSRGRGLRQFLTDLSSVATGELSEEDFIKRTQWRARKGKEYFLMKKAKEVFGEKSEEYGMAREQYRETKKTAKGDVGVVAMVPWFEGGDYSYVDIVWEYLREGGWPGEEV